MANPIFQQMQGQRAPAPMAGNPMQQNFMSFMQQMQGKDPNALIDDLVRRHGISQEKMNGIQQQAQQMAGMFNGFRSMFGFR